MPMYAEVVVDSPSDPKINFYTYRVPASISKDIAIGQIVLVPFGNKEVKGWVIDLPKKTKLVELKDVIKVLCPIPVLLPNYIKLLKWMSWYYHAPMIDCLKLMLPEFSQKQLNDLADQRLGNIKRVKQQLTIVPSLAHLAKETAELKASKDIIIYHHQLKPKEKYETWKRIYFGEARKIIGLRSAIFAPCQNLKRIKIINEEDPVYFEERSPYYNLLAVANKLCQITKASLILESKAPRIETFYKVAKVTRETKARNGTKAGQKKSFVTFRPSVSDPKGRVPSVRIINMADEIRSGNRAPISDVLRYSLIENFRKKKTSLLFLNRLKESGQLFCLECKYSGYQPKPQDVCPNCQGTYFKFYSLNLNRIANVVKSILPNAQIQFITSEDQPQVVRNKGQGTSLRPESSTLRLRPEGLRLRGDKGQTDVILATSAIFYTLNPTPYPERTRSSSEVRSSYSLVGVISADTILNFPDFRSGERTFATISQLIDLADKDGKVIIQTYNPEHPAIKFAAEQDYQSFYRQELKERKALHYPPFSIFAKLSICQKSESLAEKKAQKLYNRLLALGEKCKGVEVFPPSPSTLPQRACYNIILRSLPAVRLSSPSKSGRQEKKREVLDPFLELVPSEWKVEIEPKELT